MAQLKYSPKEAEKVLELIRAIQIEPSQTQSRKVAVTESELNSYIAYRIEREKEEVMKELQLKLLNENIIEGKVFIDLKGQELPKFLRPEMTFYFGGELEVKEGNVRLKLKSLFLDDQPIKPDVLDLVSFIAAKITKTEAGGIEDWYELPYGIKNIKTFKGRAEFYY